MMVGSFTLEGVEDTSEAHQRAWDDWLAEVHRQGFELDGDALESTDTTATFLLVRVAPALAAGDLMEAVA